MPAAIGSDRLGRGTGDALTLQAIYLFGESALRPSIVATQSRPAGSLPGTLAYELGAAVVRTIRRFSVPGS